MYSVIENVTVFRKNNTDEKGCFDDCIIVNSSFDGVDISTFDISDILKGDKLKSKLFEAEKLSEYALKKGMIFTGHRITNSTVIYRHQLKNGKILCFSDYAYVTSVFMNNLVRTDLKISSLFDLKDTHITCFNDYKGRIEYISHNKAVYAVRANKRDIKLSYVQKYFKAISKNIIVDSFTIEKADSNSSRNNDVIYKISLQYSKSNPIKIKLSELLAKYKTDIYHQKDNTLYIICDFQLGPKAHKLMTDNNIIYYCNDYNRSEIIGKEIEFDM
jgi:hypothetical protein